MKTAIVMLFFIEKVLRSVLRKGDVVVMDNVTSHKTRQVREAFAALRGFVVHQSPLKKFNRIK